MFLLSAAAAIYAGTASLRERRALAQRVIASFPTCAIPEVARLGHTLRAWRSQVLSNFDSDGLSATVALK